MYLAIIPIIFIKNHNYFILLILFGNGHKKPFKMQNKSRPRDKSPLRKMNQENKKNI